MSPWFMTPLNLHDIDGTRFELLTPLVYASATGRIITVPAGFVTDFASIPRLLWWRYPKSGKWNRAAVVHDFLYAYNGCTRAEADAIFKEALEVCGVGWRTRQQFWLAVRAGGWKPWNAYRSAEES